MGDQDIFQTIYDKGFKPYLDMFTSSLMTNFETQRFGAIITDLDVRASNIIKTFGEGRQRIVDIKSTIGDAVAGVTELGGKVGDLETIQKTMSETLRRNVILTSDSFKEIYAIHQVTGKDYATLISSFKDVGISAYQMGDRINEALAVSKQLGVNAKQVIGDMLNNMDALNKYNFQGGVEGLAEMAAHAASLRFDMKQTLNLANDVFNPEGAIKVAAAMQRLGVAQSDLLDPLRLMDLAQNDPAELQKSLEEMSRSFVKMKKDGTFEILPGEKRRLMEIESQLGMTQGSLAKLALSSAEVGEKMKKIRFGGDFTEEEQRFIASISEIGKGGDMRIRLDGENLGIDEAISKFRQDPDKLKELMKPQTVEDLAKDQLDTLEKILVAIETAEDRTGYAIGGTQAVTDLQNLGRKISDIIPRTLEAPGLKTEDLRKGLLGSFQQYITDVSKGGKTKDEASQKLGDNLSKYAENFSSFLPHLIKTTTQITTSDEISKNRFVKFGTEISGLSKAITDAKFNLLGTVLEKLNITLESNKPKQSIEVQDFVLETLPQDTLQIVNGKLVGGTKLGDNNGSMSEKIEVELKHDITIRGNNNIDTEQLKIVMKDALVKQGILEAVQSAINNNGRSGKINPLQSNLSTMSNMAGNKK